MKYTVVLTPRARRNLAEDLPEGVAAAAWEFIAGPLSDNPHQVGKRLQEPKADVFSARRGTYRILYKIDDFTFTVAVVQISHRRDAYRI